MWRSVLLHDEKGVAKTLSVHKEDSCGYAKHCGQRRNVGREN